ncbi:MAG TPA: pitrilysin family protein [Streptosporangiaceae bacterium]|jgi:predicted Zn-dependent peptidase|nr:pitrilysin family protein [Streptosporangiaceae bacterium]
MTAASDSSRESTRAGTGTERLADGESVVYRTVLPGGLRVITESLPAVRSASFGIWAGVGSRDEDLRHAGATHYLEHLLFKGTQRRTALDISAAIDAVGGELNAFTAKEYTCYYARVLDADLPLAVDVLSDMVTGSLLEPNEVEAERSVILEEIAMTDDDPSDTAHEAFGWQLFGDTPLGRPILGTVASINAITREQIAEHYVARYGPENLVVAAAGRLDHEEIVALTADCFAPLLRSEAPPAPPRLPGPAGSDVGSGTGVRLVSRPIEQANLVLGCAGLSRTDDRRFSLGVLNAALGGGMSSRLFQEIREKRGLAYSVYSFSSQHADIGVWGIYAGCLPAKADEVLSICTEEIAKVCDAGLTKEELDRGKGQLRGSIVLGLEDPASRMTRIGKSELVYPDLEPVDEILARIEAVTLDDVREVAREVLAQPKALAVVGPYDDADSFAAATAA